MKTSRWPMLLIALNLLACVILGGVWSSLRQQRCEAADELTRGRMWGQRKIDAGRAELSGIRRETETAGAALRRGPTATPVPSHPVAFERRRSTFADRLRTMPEYTNYLVRNARRKAVEDNGPALDALQLEPGRRQQLVQLLAERDLAVTDVWVLMNDQGQDPNGATAMQVRRKIGDEGNAKIRALLGEEGYRAFEEQINFQQARRYMLDAFNTALAERNLPPLSEPQLLECFRANSAARSQVRRPQSPEEWAAALRPRIPAGLSAEQTEVFIEHSYASIRRTVLRLEATQRVKGGG